MNLPVSALPKPHPTMWDLPSEDPLEPGLPDQYHGVQPQILHETLQLSDYSPEEWFVGFDINLYYDLNHTGWHKRPDWFLVVGIPHLYHGESLRSSYVTWDEGINPSVIIEFLSPGTDDEDLGRFAPKPPIDRPGKPPSKFTVYEKILKIPHYFVYDKLTTVLRYFKLVNDLYQEQPIASTAPQVWIPELKIGLVLWNGEYRNTRQPWLRWCDATGKLFPTLLEEQQQIRLSLDLNIQMLRQTQAEKEAAQAEKEAAQAEKEAAQAEKEAAQAEKEAVLLREAEAQAEKNAALLRESIAQNQNRQAIQNLLALGLSVEQVAATFNLTIAQVEDLQP
jgi:Uma2 family endonuclease